MTTETKPDLATALPIGSIFCWSWGYDQTNIDYYQVVGHTRASVRVRPIAAETIRGSEGFMSSRVRPKPDAFIGDEIETKRPKRSTYNNEWYLVKPYGWCSQVQPDESDYCSWYA